MNEFVHILFTRFNIRYSDYKVDRFRKKVRTEEWMQKRFELFTKFCLPSVRNQINQNFIWLVYFDSETELKYKSYFDKLSQEWPVFQPKYIIDGNKFAEHFKDDCYFYVKRENVKYLISSRVDNDDCLHQNAIDTIQKRFSTTLFR